MKGNIILSEQELIELRTALLKQYTELTGDHIRNPEKLLNSNLNNYTEIFENIDQKVGLRKMGIKTAKPIATLFYFSKRGAGSRSFRRKFIHAIKSYIGGEPINQPVNSEIPKNPLIENALSKLNGYWECTYATDEDSSELLERGLMVNLKVLAIKIEGEKLDTLKIFYLDTEGIYGSGSLEIYENNIVIQLKTNDLKMHSSLMLHSGGTSIYQASKHLEYMAGIFTFFDPEVGTVISSRCLLTYYNQVDIQPRYNNISPNFENEEFIAFFRKTISNNEISIQNLKDATNWPIISFFYSLNTRMEVNLFELKSSEKIAKLKKLYKTL